MSYNFKTYSDLEIAESLGDSSYILVEENGEVKRFAAAGIASAATSSKLDLYNIDNLSREEMIAFAKEYKKFLYINKDDSCNPGDLITTIHENNSYVLYYDNEDAGNDSCGYPGNPDTWTLRAGAFTLDITEEEYNEILAAWEALCVNA